MKFSIRLLYLYLFSFVGLLVTIIGSIQLVDLGIKTWIFPDADRYEMYPEAKIVEGGVTAPVSPQVSPEETKLRQDRELARNRQRTLSTAISMIAVGIPVYLYHWKTISRENKKLES